MAGRQPSADGDKDITCLPTLAWWDWPLQHITEDIRTIMTGSIAGRGDDPHGAARER